MKDALQRIVDRIDTDLSPREERWAGRLLTLASIAAFAGAWLWYSNPLNPMYDEYALALFSVGCGLQTARVLLVTGWPPLDPARLPQPTRASLPSRRVVGIVVMALLTVTTGGLGIIQFNGAIQPASAAHTDVLDDYNDGDLSEYSGATGSYAATTSRPYEGSHGLEYTAGANGAYNDISRSIPSNSYQNLSVFWEFASFGGAGNTDIKFSSGTTQAIVFGVEDTGTIQYNDGGTLVTTSTTISTGTQYRFKVKDVDYSANTWTLVVTNAATENQVFKKTGIAFKNAVGSVDTLEVSTYEAHHFADYVTTDHTFGHEVRAKLTDPSGDPLTNETVNLTQNGTVLESGTTNTDGQYTFTGVNDGDYKVVAAPSGYSDKSKSVTVNGSHIWANFSWSSGGYKQGLRLKDYTGKFPPSDSALHVWKYQPDGDFLPEEGDDWDKQTTETFNWENISYFHAYDNEMYRLEIHGPDGAVWEASGWTPPTEHPDPYVENVTIGNQTNTTENVSLTDTPGGVQIVYDGPPTDSFSYNLTGPNGTLYTGTRNFSDPTSYYQAQISDQFLNGTSDVALNYSGVWSNGSLFNGSTTLSGSTTGFFGNTSNGAGAFGPVGSNGGGGAQQLGGIALIAGIGFFAYRRFGPANLPLTAGGG